MEERQAIRMEIVRLVAEGKTHSQIGAALLWPERKVTRTIMEMRKAGIRVEIAPGVIRLTKKQEAVKELMDAGRKPSYIANKMGISERAARYTIQRIKDLFPFEVAPTLEQPQRKEKPKVEARQYPNDRERIEAIKREITAEWRGTWRVEAPIEMESMNG